MNGSSNRITGFVGAAAVVLVLALGWFLGVSPLLAQGDAAKTELAALQSQNSGIQAQVAVMQQQNDDKALYEEQYAGLSTVVPEDPADLAPFYRTVDACYKQVAAIKGAPDFVPGAVTTSNAVAWGTTGTIGGPPPGGGIQEEFYLVPTTVTAEGINGSTALALVDCLQTESHRLYFISGVDFTDDKSAEVTISGQLYVVTSRPQQTVGEAGAPVPAATPAPSETPAANAAG